MIDTIQYGIFLDLQMIPRVYQVLSIYFNHFIDDTNIKLSPFLYDDLYEFLNGHGRLFIGEPHDIFTFPSIIFCFFFYFFF
jgi:hypothetical protein